MKLKLSIVMTMTLINLNLQAYDKELTRFINDTVEQKMVDYAALKKENVIQKEQLQEFKERVEELEETIELVETKTLVDKIDFSLGFTTTVNSYDKKYADSHTHQSNNLYSTKLMLNMDAKIADNMKFSGKLSMYKYWADSTMHMYSQYDNMQGRVPGDSGLFVERAFVDWKITDNDSPIPSILTIGRQPSSDGPSHQFKANTTRKATYSALVFDGASDGIVLTSSLKNISPLKNSNLRFGYGKGYQNDQTKLSSNAFIGSDNALKDTDVYGLFFESLILNKPNTLFQVGVASMQNIIANALEPNEETNKNIGDVTFLGTMVEGTNINNSGFDLFAHFAYSQAKPSHDAYTYNNMQFSLLSNGDDFSDKSATAFWLGGRYTFDNNSKIGLEYNQGSKYWLTASQGSFDLLNKLATRGKAYEAYYIHPINRYSFLRLGGTYVDYDYTNSGWFVGEPMKLSTSNSSESMNSIKNIYLQFGLNY